MDFAQNGTFIRILNKAAHRITSSVCAKIEDGGFFNVSTPPKTLVLFVDVEHFWNIITVSQKVYYIYLLFY